MLDPTFFLPNPNPPSSPPANSVAVSPALSFTFTSPFILFLTFVSLTFHLLDLKQMIWLPPCAHVLRNPALIVRTLTHPLAHLDTSHWFYNYKQILLLGPSMETHYGTAGMVKIYVLSSVTSAIVHWLFGGSSAALLGSSGVLFSLIGLHCCSTFIVTKNRGELPVTFVIAICIFLGEEVFLGVTRGDNVSRLTHVSGGIVGVAVGVLMKIRESKEKNASFWTRWFGSKRKAR